MTNFIGKQFGVLLLSRGGRDYDFSLPRTEAKTFKGHKGFDVLSNPSLTFKEAANRRDFTINAMGVHLITREVVDPYGGYQEFKRKTIKACFACFF